MKNNNFLFTQLNPTHKVLEYGSGYSTIEIGKRVETLYSVEHDDAWVEKIKRHILENTTILYHAPNYTLQNHEDGTYDQFKQYVECPEKYAPFDIIIIDGRARYACAKFAIEKLCHNYTKIFIDDFSLDIELLKLEQRDDYIKVLDFLEIVNNEERLFQFKIK